MKQKMSQRIILKLAIGLVSLCSLLTLAGILAKVYGGYHFDILTNSGGIFFIAGCSLLFFHYLVGRHLESLARQIGRLDVTNHGAALALSRRAAKGKDELDAVVSALNTTLERARQAYKTLASNEERLLLFFDSTEEAIIGVDRDDTCTFANDNCLQLLGKKEYEEILGKKLSTLFTHSDDKGSWRGDSHSCIHQVMEKGMAHQCDDGFIVLPFGKKIFASLRAYPVFKAGEVTGALVFINDNSEKRQLLRERELLSQAIEQVPVMIVIADAEQRIQYANSGAEQLTGFSRRELLHQSIFLTNDGYSAVDAHLAAAKDDLLQGKKWEGLLETRSKWGKPLKFFSVISPVFDESRRLVNLIAVAREVSYEIAMQNEVIKNKKMEAVSRLSASFAHEFGNPLFGVRSVLSDFSERITYSENDKYLLELAHGECERMRNMVREFQQLDRQHPASGDVLEIPRIIGAVLLASEPLLTAHNIHTLCDFSDATRDIVGNTGKLSVVLESIITNGVESMAGGGGILRISTTLKGDCLQIQVGDSGGGIKTEHQEYIFEPFFSTKAAVEGKGLGLSMAYGTMKGLGGTITFVSEEGKGSVFTIHLPLKEANFTLSQGFGDSAAAPLSCP